LAAPEEVSAASDAVKPAPAAARAETRADRIVRSALTYRGAPYRRGAMGRGGAFDCSGFTKYLFDHEGASLPRTAADQYRRGTPVSREELRPGDLVFFKNTYKAGISHVGIYIGEGRFIHAASTRTGVRVDTLDKPYYVNHYAGARRPQ
jgi:cell wall-associated NlpC family hydrolase